MRSSIRMGGAFERSLEAGFAIGIGMVLGYYVDVWLGTSPIFLFLLSLAGLAACVRALMRIKWPEPPGEDRSGDA